MRKDYVAIAGDAVAQGESEFVADHWTKVWRDMGGPSGMVDGVPGKEEFKVIQPYVARLPRGARLLDGGCGLGEWTAFYTRAGFPTLGLDISAGTVEQLRQVYPDQEFAVGDIRATKLPASSVDGYFSWGTFEHFENGIHECVAEAWRILKPGGYLFVSTPFDNLRHALTAAFDGRDRKAPARQAERFYQWRFTRPELRDMLSRDGFEVLEVRRIGKVQGTLRALDLNFGLKWQWRVSKMIAASSSIFLPAALVAHMILAVARKPL